MVRRSQAQAGVDSEGTPDGKRQKVEEPETTANAVLDAGLVSGLSEAKHLELWWRDGNTVVAADGLSFKVHASILEKYSSVFRELLEALQDAENPVMYEGCRVLRVDDKGEHLAALLQILYDGGSGIFADWRKPIQFPALRRVTLLAVKYKVQHIIDEAVARLVYVFPTSFDPDRVERDCYMKKDKSYPVLFDDDAAVISVVTLAREINPTDPPPFIVMALYHCVSFTAKTLLTPFQYDGDTIVLSLADRITCLDQVESLAEANKNVKKPVIDALAKPMCASPTCHSGLTAVLRQWFLDGHLSTFMALGSCTNTFQQVASKNPNRKVCETCTAELTKAIDDQRRALFADLGKRFGVSTWPAQPQPE